MKRLACILILFISVCVYGNTHILKNSSDPQSNASSQKERQHNTTDCWISHENELWGVHQYEKDSLNFILYFYDYTGQIQFAVKDIAPNNTPVPENSKRYCPGALFEFRGNCSGFYESGHKQESGVCFFDEDPIIDYYEYGEWKKYDDFGKSIPNKYETENSVVFETFTEGQLNGTQVFMGKEPKHVQRINYYEMGALKAQIIFDNDNQITKIAYEITPNDASAGGRYKCKFISYNTNGTKAKSCTMFFDGPLDGGEILFP